MGASGGSASPRRVASYLRRRGRRDRYAPRPRWDRAWAWVLGRRPTGRSAARFLRADRIRARVVEELFRVEDALWLGVLDPEHLAEIDRRHYAEAIEMVGTEWVGWAEPELNRAGIAAWERDLIVRHVPAGGRVVVVGAGAGRELRALLGAGYDAVGYEPNERLVAAGRRDTLEPVDADRLRVSERDAVPAGERCDAVLVGWNAYSHIAGHARRVAFLEQAGAALRPGGTVLLSFPERGRDGPLANAKRAATSALRLLRGRPPAELGDTLDPNFRHRFTGGELAAEIRQAGLELVEHVSASQPHAAARRPGLADTAGAD